MEKKENEKFQNVEITSITEENFAKYKTYLDTPLLVAYQLNIEQFLVPFDKNTRCVLFYKNHNYSKPLVAVIVDQYWKSDLIEKGQSLLDNVELLETIKTVVSSKFDMDNVELAFSFNESTIKDLKKRFHW